jgi:tight adherence protein B
MVISGAVFALVLAIIVGAYWTFVVRPEGHDERALWTRLKARRTGVLPAGFVKARQQMSAVGPLDGALLRWQSALDPLTRLIAQAGLSITVGTVLLAAVFLALVTGGLVAFFASSTLLAIAAAAAAALMPIVYVRRAARRRLATFEEQFPEAMDLIARALRAGHALNTALQMAGDEIADPVGVEFRTLFDQQNFGMSIPEALRAFAIRVPLVDARFFVTAVLTQREAGGNLAEVLDKLAAVIRDRFQVKRQVQTISAHGRITGFVLGFLPPTVALILFIIAPEHMHLLVSDPIGVDMVIAAVVMQVIGVLIIRRIVDVEY